MTSVTTHISFLLLMYFLVFHYSHAMDIPDGIKVVTAPEVRKMVQTEQVVLIHVLSQIEFQMQHIPGSINISADEVSTSSLMPEDKQVAIIFYCNGLACPYSRKAAIAAVAKAYKQVYWFRGGILEWRKYQYKLNVNKELVNIKVNKYSPDIFQKKMKLDNVLVIDVRPKWWRESKEKAGIIRGTEMLIPLIKLDSHFHLIPKDRPILLVDRLMRQSVPAAKYLMDHNYKVLGVLRGGTKYWVEKDYPVLNQAEEADIEVYLVQ